MTDTLRKIYNLCVKYVPLTALTLFLTASPSAAQKTLAEVQLLITANKACQAGDFQKAVSLYKKALSEYNSADAAFNLGITYEIDFKNREQASYYYQKFLQLEPDSEDSAHVKQWVKEVRLYLKHKTNQEKQTATPAKQSAPAAKRYLKDLPQDNIKAAQNHLKEGNLAALKGDYKTAIEHYEKVLTFYDSSDTYYNLGMIYAKKLNNNKKALFYYKKFLKLEPNSPQAKEIKRWIKTQSSNNQ